MFVRKQRNRSGTITVVVVDKHYGKFREVHNLSTAKTEAEADLLCVEGEKWIASSGGCQPSLDLFPEETRLSRPNIFDCIQQIRQDGAYRLLESVYDGIGFCAIPDKPLKGLR